MARLSKSLGERRPGRGSHGSETSPAGKHAFWTPLGTTSNDSECWLRGMQYTCIDDELIRKVIFSLPPIPLHIIIDTDSPCSNETQTLANTHAISNPSFQGQDQSICPGAYPP